MKAAKLITLLMLTAFSCGQSLALERLYRLQDATPAPSDTAPANILRSPVDEDEAKVGGAASEKSEAEKLKDAEEQYQAQLVAVARAVHGLEQRVKGMRAQASPPGRMDVDRISRDLSLTEDELNKITISGLSPLTQIQRNDLHDRLFEIRLSMEILKSRWGSSWEVFGMDFFSGAPTPPGPEQGRVPPNYRIRVGDTLRVLVHSRMGAQNEYRQAVGNTGTLFVSGAGNVHAAGKTAGQVEQFISSKIRSKFGQLRVEVTVEKLATLRVQVAGEVARPGTYVVTGMATVFSALYQAGGPSKTGTFRRLSLVREGRPPRRLDLYDFLLRGSKSDDVLLEDGDLIFVPPVGGTLVVDGEVVRPGRYEPDFPISLADMLKMAGGVKPGGYLQTVQVERVENGECKVLLSTPLKGGDGSVSFVLEPGDQITVSAVRTDRTNQVEVMGPVGAPGIYGFRDGMRVADLVKLAQGLDSKSEVYTARADILRTNLLGGSEILTLDLARALSGDPNQNLELRKLDRLFVYEPDQVEFRPRLVTVLGAVAKPGIYKRTDGMCVSDVIAAAGGVLPNAHLARADMIRRVSDDATELARIDLRSALSRDASANLKLNDRDEITVYTLDEAGWRDRSVRIEGAVQRPGVYARSENMRISDLLFACGGLLPESAQIAEVAQCGDAGQSTIVKVDLAGLSAGTAVGTEADVLLHDRDVVTVPSLNPSIRSAEIVYLGGEVQKPGPYALNGRNDKLADLITRAGGLTQYADVRGMLFLRQKESFENAQQGKDVDIILERSRAFADKQFLTHLAKLGVGLPGQFIQAVQQSAGQLSKPAAVVAEEKLSKTSEGSDEEPEDGSADFPHVKSSEEEALQRISESDKESGKDANKVSAMGPRVAPAGKQDLSSFEGRRELALLANSARVSVNLARAFDDSSSPDNITMREGDRIFIPRITNVVKVIGAVLHPHSFAAGPGRNVEYYIQRSGGFAQDAAKGSVVVVRSNGDALPQDEVRSVEPGDTIVVPTTGLIDIAKRWERVGSVTKVVSDILGSVFILTRF